MWPLRRHRRQNAVGYARQQRHSVEINVRGLNVAMLDQLIGAFLAHSDLVAQATVTKDRSRLNLTLNTQIVMPSTTRVKIARLYHQTLGWQLCFTDDPPPPRQVALHVRRWRFPWRSGIDTAEDASDGMI